MKRLMMYCAALAALTTTGLAREAATVVETAGPATWAAEDALGRKVGFYAPKDPADRKEVLMFYWTWHDRDESPGTQIKNIREILRDNPNAMNDANLPCWTNGCPDNIYHWDEPLFGYYKTWDRWVLRKHAEMLAAAGVDAVAFDCSNYPYTWDRSTRALLETWEQARKDGVAVPKVTFILPFFNPQYVLTMLRHIHAEFYRNGAFDALWYRREGKPCVMACPDAIQSAEDLHLKEYFTFRPAQPDYVAGPTRPDQWAWLENYPQHGFRTGRNGKPEFVPVGVAQNACAATKGHCSAFNLPGTYSRSFTQRHGYDKRPEAWLYGANFLEQWDRAYELDPEIVFVTGWNEWVAGRWFERDGWTAKPFSFVDEFDADRSRDLEPVKSWGEKGDVYYCQLVDRVRKFKGGAALPRPSAPKTIRLKSRGDWVDVSPSYPASRGNTLRRDAIGYACIRYTDDSARNDIVETKVARDAKHVWFAIRAAAPLTPSSDRAWMTLFVDTDRAKATGWQGYDLVVNRLSPEGGKAVVEVSDGKGWTWRRVAQAACHVDGDLLVLELPRALFGSRLDFEFKVGDNLRLEGDVMDFYVSGDVAPLGRFNYVFTE